MQICAYDLIKRRNISIEAYCVYHWKNMSMRYYLWTVKFELGLWSILERMIVHKNSVEDYVSCSVIDTSNSIHRRANVSDEHWNNQTRFETAP